MPENNIKNNSVAFKVSAGEIVKVISDLRDNKKLSLKLVTATDERRESGCFKIWYIMGSPKEKVFTIPFICLENTDEFPSISSIFKEAGNDERKIKTFFGLTPVGCSDLRPIILHENWPDNVFPLRKDFDWNTRPKQANGKYKFDRVEGEGIYEIPVGPIHAGIIEPGHFRFSVLGEEILQLEPKLGFTHKGVEKLFEKLPMSEKVRLSEKVSGDSSFSHSLAFCQAVENLSDSVVPSRAKYLRVIYAELERLANHIGDIGAIMIDTGFNFGGSQGARLREMIMQINERLTGSRFLRGVNQIGGVTKDIDDETKNLLALDLEKIHKDLEGVIAVANESVSLSDRLNGTGTLSREVADAYGIMGVAGKAIGIQRDTRVDYPYAAYDEIVLDKIETEKSGDVYARFQVRIKEVRASVGIIKRALSQLPEGSISTGVDVAGLKKNSLSVGLVEGWRGEILYFITTDNDGNISRVAPRDPSFINWTAVALAGPGNVVPDFPLINKSFNMSYTGNDL